MTKTYFYVNGYDTSGNLFNWNTFERLNDAISYKRRMESRFNKNRATFDITEKEVTHCY